jgi:hypothetical protein
VIIISLAGCSVRPFRIPGSEFRIPTCPAVFERVFETSNAVTSEMQSRAVRNDAAFSAVHKPSGLTIPRAVTATRWIGEVASAGMGGGSFRRDVWSGNGNPSTEMDQEMESLVVRRAA